MMVQRNYQRNSIEREAFKPMQAVIHRNTPTLHLNMEWAGLYTRGYLVARRRPRAHFTAPVTLN